MKRQPIQPQLWLTNMEIESEQIEKWRSEFQKINEWLYKKSIGERTAIILTMFSDYLHDLHFRHKGSAQQIITYCEEKTDNQLNLLLFDFINQLSSFGWSLEEIQKALLESGNDIFKKLKARQPIIVKGKEVVSEAVDRLKKTAEKEFGEDSPWKHHLDSINGPLPPS